MHIWRTNKYRDCIFFLIEGCYIIFFAYLNRRSKSGSKIVVPKNARSLKEVPPTPEEKRISVSIPKQTSYYQNVSPTSRTMPSTQGPSPTQQPPLDYANEIEQNLKRIKREAQSHQIPLPPHHQQELSPNMIQGTTRNPLRFHTAPQMLDTSPRQPDQQNIGPGLPRSVGDIS